MTPTTAERWLEVAHERGTDAYTLKSQGRSLASVYMIGYTVECTLKALLQRNGKKIPTSGREGHDLRSLWEAVGFKLHDIQGNRRHFIERWTTNLRYLHSFPVQTDDNVLYSGAVELTGYIQKHIRRSKSKGRRGGSYDPPRNS